jgi:hypothetical protein
VLCLELFDFARLCVSFAIKVLGARGKEAERQGGKEAKEAKDAKEAEEAKETEEAKDAEETEEPERQGGKEAKEAEKAKDAEEAEEGPVPLRRNRGWKLKVGRGRETGAPPKLSIRKCDVLCLL